MHTQKDLNVVGRIYIIILSFIMAAMTSCEFKLMHYGEEDGHRRTLEIKRYDRLQCRYLTTGDFSALQQMNTEYAVETRMLIEDVLRLGVVNDPAINSKMLKYYQDSTLQAIVMDVEARYADMSDVAEELDGAFMRMKKHFPKLPIPEIYTQIGALDQSIVVGDDAIGICLDKYLGEDYPLYARYYTKEQRKAMKREMIAADCLLFYIISAFPLDGYDLRSKPVRDRHAAKVMWVVNSLLGKKVFDTPFVDDVEAYARQHPQATYTDILRADNVKSGRIHEQ